MLASVAMAVGDPGFLARSLISDAATSRANSPAGTTEGLVVVTGAVARPFGDTADCVVIFLGSSDVDVASVRGLDFDCARTAELVGDLETAARMVEDVMGVLEAMSVGDVTLVAGVRAMVVRVPGVALEGDTAAPGVAVVTSMTVGREAVGAFSMRVLPMGRLPGEAMSGRTRRGLEVRMTLPLPLPPTMPPPLLLTPPALTTTEPILRERGSVEALVAQPPGGTPKVLVMTMEGLAILTLEAEVTLVNRKEAADVLGLPEYTLTPAPPPRGLTALPLKAAWLSVTTSLVDSRMEVVMGVDSLLPFTLMTPLFPFACVPVAVGAPSPMMLLREALIARPLEVSDVSLVVEVVAVVVRVWSIGRDLVDGRPRLFQPTGVTMVLPTIFLACTSDAFGDVVMTVASDPVVVTVVVGENMGGVSFNSFPVKLLNISPPAAPTPAPPPMVLLVLLMLLMLLLPLLLLLPLPLCVLVLGVSLSL